MLEIPYHFCFSAFLCDSHDGFFESLLFPPAGEAAPLMFTKFGALALRIWFAPAQDACLLEEHQSSDSDLRDFAQQ